jgi:hypothetical protein
VAMAKRKRERKRKRELARDLPEPGAHGAIIVLH